MGKNIDIYEAMGIPPLPNNNPDTIAALLWARDLFRKHRATTYKIRDPKGIDELKPIKIGGVEQWLHIRGRNKNNPVLLWLHGGPGGPVIGLMDSIQRPWEDYFTVVHWDQRQTGKSYYSAKDKTDQLTVELFIKDTEAVVDYLRNYLGQPKLSILGSSWGSVLGMHIVKHHPEWLHTYIGVGQVVNSMDAEQLIYERLLHHAKEQGEDKIITHLEAITPKFQCDYPEREKSLVENGVMVRRELSRLAGETLMHHLFFDDVVTMINFDKLTSPHLELTDISNSIFGDDKALYRAPYDFARDFYSINLPDDVGSSFEVPIFFFTGLHDWQTPFQLSDHWFSQIKAPHKKLIHFTESSHCVVNEEPGKFLVALVEEVLPYTKS